MSLQRLYFPASELRVSESDGQRSISWYPAVFDSLSEDLGGFREKVGRRAFSKTVAEGDVRALFNHDPNHVLGRNKSGTLTLRVDTRGLHAEVTPPDTQWANDLMVSVERGDITAGSFGFNVLRDTWGVDESGMPIRTLNEVRLFDVSLVTYPAYPGTDGTPALRDLLGIDINELLLPIARSRAGVLTAEDRERYTTTLEAIRAALPSVTPDESDEDEPAPQAEQPAWRTQLAKAHLMMMAGHK